MTIAKATAKKIKVGGAMLIPGNALAIPISVASANKPVACQDNFRFENSEAEKFGVMAVALQ
jgi:hypothetical protein